MKRKEGKAGSELPDLRRFLEPASVFRRGVAVIGAWVGRSWRLEGVEEVVGVVVGVGARAGEG